MFDLIYHLVFGALYHRTRNVEHQECRRWPSKTITSRYITIITQQQRYFPGYMPATLRSSPDIRYAQLIMGGWDFVWQSSLGFNLQTGGPLALRWSSVCNEPSMMRCFFSGAPTCLKDHWQLLWLDFFILFPYLILDVPKHPLKVCN